MNISKNDRNDLKIGEGVIETLQAEGEVFVIIALVEPTSMKAPQRNLSILRDEIARLQDQVLASVDASDFNVVYRYEAVPALTGRVTETGLAKLIASANVVRIDLDVGGSGSQ